MEKSQEVTRHHAILIGINAYPENPLTSCIRDIEKIRKCLEQRFTRIRVRELKASDLQSSIVESLEWPSNRNIESAFEETTSEAQKGDFVYIHYSGHGTTLSPRFDFSNKQNEDLALVVLKGEQSQETLLHGPRLAGYLKAMVDKELFVTLVLDCCFSACVYRNSNADVRYMPCDTSTGSASSTFRDGSMRDNWFLEPDRYTILAACGPHEEAKVGFEMGQEGEKYGALSHFLYEELCSRGFNRKHREIHRRLCARFRQHGIAQHPVLYGNANQGFFGNVDAVTVTRACSVTVNDDGLKLLAGEAHGLQKGDQFALSPLGITNNQENKGSIVAQVINTRSLTSDLKLSKLTREVQTGWVASPLSCASLTRFPVSLASDIGDRNDWLAALKQRSLNLCSDQTAPSFRLVLKEEFYEVLDRGNQEIANLPPMPRNGTEIHHVCDILEYLARFNMVKALKNDASSSAFQDLFDIYMLKDGKQFRPDSQIQIEHGRFLELVVKKRGNAALYTHVYNLTPPWNVKPMFHGTYDAIRPYKKELVSRKKIRMTVPGSMEKSGSCKDVIKVFLTSHPTSFDLLEVAGLDEQPSTSGANRPSYHNNSEPEEWAVVSFEIQVSL